MLWGSGLGSWHLLSEHCTPSPLRSLWRTSQQSLDFYVKLWDGSFKLFTCVSWRDSQAQTTAQRAFGSEAHSLLLKTMARFVSPKCFIHLKNLFGLANEEMGFVVTVLYIYAIIFSSLIWPLPLLLGPPSPKSLLLLQVVHTPLLYCFFSLPSHAPFLSLFLLYLDRNHFL